MIKNTIKYMEKIMRGILLMFLWSFLLFYFNSCMPIDIEPSPFDKENFAPMIRLTTPDVLHSPYNLKDITSGKLIVKVIDLNTLDALTLAWYVKDANNQLEVPFKEFTIREATDNENSEKSIFEFQLKENDFVCGLNRVILLVSDRGIKEGGLSGEDGYPYPSNLEKKRDKENASKVKIDTAEWLIQRICP